MALLEVLDGTIKRIGRGRCLALCFKHKVEIMGIVETKIKRCRHQTLHEPFGDQRAWLQSLIHMWPHATSEVPLKLILNFLEGNEIVKMLLIY